MPFGHGRNSVVATSVFGYAVDPARLDGAVGLMHLKIKVLNALMFALQGNRVGDVTFQRLISHSELKNALDKTAEELSMAVEENSRRAADDMPLLFSPALLSKAVQELFSIRLIVRNECKLSTALLAPPRDRAARRARRRAVESLRATLLTSEVVYQGRCQVVVFTAPPYAGGGGDALVDDLVEQTRVLTVSARVSQVVRNATLFTDAMAMTWRLTNKSVVYQKIQKHETMLKWSVYALVVVLFGTISLSVDRSHRIAEHGGLEPEWMGLGPRSAAPSLGTLLLVPQDRHVFIDRRSKIAAYAAAVLVACISVGFASFLAIASAMSEAVAVS